MAAGRVEVITSTERRRSYTDAERAAILAECAEPDAVIAAVARRYGIAESVIYGWRSKQRADAAQASEPLQFIPYGAVAAAPAAEVPAARSMLVPAPVPEAPRLATAAPAVAPVAPPAGALRPTVGAEPGTIGVELPTGVRLTVDAYVNEKALARVLRVLRALDEAP